MYKVFVNDKPIILSNQIMTDLDYEFCLFNDIRFEEVLHKLRYTQTKGFYIYNSDLSVLWEEFKALFEVVKAAGGLVFKNRSLLLIYRNEHWDLPKGKSELGETFEETALREVEEECGVKNLVIEKPIQATFHVFYENNTNKLKKTHWFIMSSTHDEKLIPQKIEGISKAEFVPLDDIPYLYNRMYANISELLTKYLNLSIDENSSYKRTKNST